MTRFRNNLSTRGCVLLGGVLATALFWLIAACFAASLDPRAVALTFLSGIICCSLVLGAARVRQWRRGA